ncbi:XylR family transcriptional regulator, partial [Micromonospora zhanjiangensis]
MSTAMRSGGSRAARWRVAAEVLAYLRDRPHPTRADLTRDLGLSSGSATEITARLRHCRLLGEEPAPVVGRGRPTTVLRPHPDGPLVLAMELRQEESRWAVATLDGRLHETGAQRHGPGDVRRVLAALAGAVRQVHHRHGGRLRTVSVAAAATVRHGRVVQSAALGWGPVDLSVLVAAAGLLLLVGNDATLAGAAEARTG